jgi:hypothetical protein
VTAPRESRWAGRVRLVAIAAFAVTLFLPVHRCEARVGHHAAALRADRSLHRRNVVQVPIDEIREHATRGLADGGVVDAVWRARAWYPYLLLPLWLLALFLRWVGGGAARAAGGVIFATTAAILALEFAYVKHDFGGILPRALRPVEVVTAWIVVTAILVWRRHGRSLFDVEAGISAHALLCALHGFTFIADDLRVWSGEGRAVSAMVAAIARDYLPAFWVAEAALIVAAAPAYLPIRARSPAGESPAAELTREPA